MDWRRVKSILIIFMLIINLALLTLLVWRRVSDRHVAARAREEMHALLEGQGLHAPPGVIPDENVSATALEVTRDPAIEQALVAVLIGEVTPENLGGNIITYQGAGGSAGFQTGGEFAVLSEAPILLPAGESVTERIGLLLQGWGGQLPPEQMGDGTVTVTQVVNGLPVWGNGIVVALEGDSVAALSGCWVSGTLATLAQQGMSAGYCLLRYAAEMQEQRTVEEIQLGYYAAAIDPETVQLTPVWRVRFSGEHLFLDALTGDTLDIG